MWPHLSFSEWTSLGYYMIIPLVIWSTNKVRKVIDGAVNAKVEHIIEILLNNKNDKFRELIEGTSATVLSQFETKYVSKETYNSSENEICRRLDRIDDRLDSIIANKKRRQEWNN